MPANRSHANPHWNPPGFITGGYHLGAEPAIDERVVDFVDFNDPGAVASELRHEPAITDYEGLLGEPELKELALSAAKELIEARNQRRAAAAKHLAVAVAPVPTVYVVTATPLEVVRQRVSA